MTAPSRNALEADPRVRSPHVEAWAYGVETECGKCGGTKHRDDTGVVWGMAPSGFPGDLGWKTCPTCDGAGKVRTPGPR